LQKNKNIFEPSGSYVMDFLQIHLRRETDYNDVEKKMQEQIGKK
jgi:hypothetical protein